MGNEVSKNYSDRAMFTAEPVAQKTPKVYLLNATPDPLGSISAMNFMYTGKVVRNLSEVTYDDRVKHWEDVQKTVLKAPLESVKLHFMFESVTRAFTHQLVRQRTAVYAQESMRFAVKENATDEVALPPSIMGVEPFENFTLSAMTKEQQALDIWTTSMDQLGEAYNKLIELGMPAEDARGMLPTNILTRIHYITDLRALQQHAGFRLCTQAQFEWRMVWAGILTALREYNSCGGHATAQESVACRLCDNWQWHALATIFKPICYQTGKCEFMSQIDRHCTIRDRVNANHDINRPSTEWGEEHDPFEDPMTTRPGVGTRAEGVVRLDGNPVFIGAIQPREWMADPAAARTK